MKFLLLMTIFLSFSSLLISGEKKELAHYIKSRDALFDASYNKNVQEMNALLESNPALANSRGDVNDSDPIINFTVRHGDVNCLQCLIDHNADVNTQELYAFKHTPLHTALSSCNPFDIYTITDDREKAQLLIAHGALVNAQDACKDTPLHYCVNLTDPKPRMKLLLQHNAHINAKGNQGETVLHKAIHTAHISSKIIKFLLKNGACPNIQDKCGLTPLHLAASIGCFVTVSLLLQYGADITIQNNLKQTPLDIANIVNANHYPEVKQVILLLKTIMIRESKSSRL